MKTQNNIQLAKKLNKLRQRGPVNLVLGGGGVKGVAHIALLEFLEKHKIRINAISGSSAGALVGALYCSGMPPKQMFDFFVATPIFRYTWLNPVKAGIFDSEKYALVIKEHVRSNFNKLKIPLTIVATNIEKNKAVYFNTGSLIPPLLASCAVPAVFSPVKVNVELYSDGGVMDNFPVFPFLNKKQPIIGSYISTPSKRKAVNLNGIVAVTQHTYSLLSHAANVHKFEQTNFTINFPLGKYGAFNTKKISAIYQVAKKHLLK